MGKARGLALVALLVGWIPAGTSAQSVIVIPASLRRPPTDELRATVTSALLAAQVAPALPGTVQERLGLAPPQSAPEGLTLELGRAAEEILELVARGESQAVIERGEAILSRVRSHLAAVGRDAQAAADLANVCLHLVRAELQRGQEDAAADRARLCWYLVPDLPADERVHPPNVRQIAASVRSDLDAGSTVLAVRALPGEEASCGILLNGRPVGETPEVRRAVVPGRYSVQTECDTSGPVRHVDVMPGNVERVRLRPLFEAALQLSEDGPGLVYQSREQSSRRLAIDAGHLARAAGAPEAVVALLAGQGAILFLVRVPRIGEPRVVAEASVADASSERSAREAVRQLLGAEWASSGDSGIAGDEGEMDADGLSAATIVALTVAGAGLFTGAVFSALAFDEYGRLEDGCGPMCSDDEVSALNTYTVVADIGWVAAAVGGVISAILLATRTARDTSSRAELMPWIAPSRAGILVRAEM